MKKMIIILTKIKGGAETILQTTWPVLGLIDWGDMEKQSE
jgi:hypothetical protein